MEQNTEASQAVDDTVERGKFVTEYLRYMAKEAPQSHPEMVYSMAHTRWGGIAGVMWRAGRAALKAQPALTEALPKLVIALPDYEQSRLVIASDEMIDGERVVCAAIKSAPTEAAQGGYMVRMTVPDAMRIVKANWPDMGRIERAFFANVPSTSAAQGEDSARLDWKRITAPGQVKVGDKLRFTIGDEKFSERVKQIINPGYPDEELIYNKRRNFYVITSNAITNFGSSKNVEFLARASAKTGGAKL